MKNKETIKHRNNSEGSLGNRTPKGWEIKKLGEVYDVRDGTHDSPRFIKEGFALITSKNLKNDLLNYNNVNYISEQDFININKRSKVDIGDVLFAMIGTIGNPVVIKEIPDFAIKNVALFKIPKEQDSYFLKYYLDSKIVIDKMAKDAKGATQKFVGLGYLRAFSIPLPPLSEQRRIVAILDETFAAISKATVNTEQNAKNVKYLFESYLQSEFVNKSKDWVEKRLGEITTKIGSGATPRGGSNSYKTEGISLIRSMNVHDLKFKERNLAFIDDHQANALSNVTLQVNDVLINITGASVTRCCIIPEEYLPARVNQHVSIIRAKKEIIEPSFLNLLLTSKFYKDQLLYTGEQGATRQAITKAQLEVFKIAFPKPIKEQQSIVKKLEVFSAETKKLEAIYQQKLLNLEELKKSILQKAFNGEL